MQSFLPIQRQDENEITGYAFGRRDSRGDRIEIDSVRDFPLCTISENAIPQLHSPHRLRITEGPEFHYFSASSQKTIVDRKSKTVYDVSASSNRTGIRLKGPLLAFRAGVDKSIISEGILPGTVQIPGDGLPNIMLYEQTMGGYARIARVIKANIDSLAHLKPGDTVLFEVIGMDDAEALWKDRQESIISLTHNIRRVS